MQLRSTSCDLPLETAERSSLPLELHSTRCWHEEGTSLDRARRSCLTASNGAAAAGFRVFDIVHELVQKVAAPRPANVYAVDHDALARLPDGERALMTGALHLHLPRAAVWRPSLAHADRRACSFSVSVSRGGAGRRSAPPVDALQPRAVRRVIC